MGLRSPNAPSRCKSALVRCSLPGFRKRVLFQKFFILRYLKPGNTL